MKVLSPRTPAAGADLRHDWSLEEIAALHDLPFPELIYRAQTIHRRHHDPSKVQLCTLLSVKTGGCPEDCGYCPQSAHYRTGVEASPLLAKEEVLRAARQAKDHGSTRFCMGAAWREARNGREFDTVVEMVEEVGKLGLETCVTLGMLTAEQACRLKEAGLTAYNHNLDTSPEFYGEIITTRTYQDRLRTLENVRAAGITVCCGGIIGMGEEKRDRLRLLQVLSSLDPHPESVPINLLVPVQGTPLAAEAPVPVFELPRLVAAARILMPRSLVRLSAGRTQMSPEAQALGFLAGANSIFTGEKLLTTPNPGEDHDRELLKALGMEPLK
jgi:biotin synthase